MFIRNEIELPVTNKPRQNLREIKISEMLKILLKQYLNIELTFLTININEAQEELRVLIRLLKLIYWFSAAAIHAV